MAKKICEKCKRQMQDTKFYTYKNGEKFKQCKSCLTLHVDNFNPDTFLWILEEADVPYIPQKWNTIRDKAYAKNPLKMNGTSVLGKYLSAMKLKQYKESGWADSEKEQKKYNDMMAAREKEDEAYFQQVKTQYENHEISQAQYRTLTSTEYQKQHQYIIENPQPKHPISVIDPEEGENPFNQENFLPEQQMPQLGIELTLEEKQQLALKWGRIYKVSEWIQLQKKYKQMADAFSINDPDSKNSLIFICKTYLKMNQAIDCGDLEGYQKLSRVYDQLRKSAKFTAAQNKQDKKDFVDSVGQLVAYCEQHGGQIPKYEITTPHDIIDKIIIDLKEYTRNLIYEDTALSRQIEDYIKEAKAVLQKRKDKEQALAKGLQNYELTDQDILNFKEFIAEEKNNDEEIVKEEDET